MITYIPHPSRTGYSPTEIKDAVKDAYYEIQKEEAERAQRERTEKIMQAKIDRANRVFDEVVGEALLNGEEVKF